MDLQKTKLVIGGKYVPHQKTVYGGLVNSFMWRTAKKKKQPFIYYLGSTTDELNEGAIIHAFSYQFPDKHNGDFFNPEDVTPYIEPNEEVGESLLSDFTLEEDIDKASEIYAKTIVDKTNYGSSPIHLVMAFKEGKNWHQEQTQALQESHDKLLEALEQLSYQLTGEQQDEDELERGLGVTLAMRVQVAKTAIENAKKLKA